MSPCGRDAPRCSPFGCGHTGCTGPNVTRNRAGRRRHCGLPQDTRGEHALPAFGLIYDPGVRATAEILDRLPGTILALDDLVYPNGSADDFENCYAPTWGRYKARTRPVPGNHDYASAGGAPYHSYWGERAGAPGKGYYSFEIGARHVVVLNSDIDGSTNSAQADWLRRDLAANGECCTLALLQHPRFNSGQVGNQAQVADLFQTLVDHGTTIVLSGHAHNYERFAPQGADGRPDANGTRLFVVGIGDADLRPMKTGQANSEVFQARAWGVLKLALSEGRYAWEFVSAAGGGFRDSGVGACVERRNP
jgi:hypothetical protein